MSKFIKLALLILFSIQFISCTTDELSDKSGPELEAEYSQTLSELKDTNNISTDTSESQISDLNIKISKLNQLGRKLRSLDNDKYGELVLEGELFVISLRQEIRATKKIKLASEKINLQFNKIKNRSEELEASGLDTTSLTTDEKIDKKILADEIINLANQYDEMTIENNPCESNDCDDNLAEQLFQQRQFIDTKKELSTVVKNQIEQDLSIQ